jgi:hypothetical protein
LLLREKKISFLHLQKLPEFCHGQIGNDSNSKKERCFLGLEKKSLIPVMLVKFGNETSVKSVLTPAVVNIFCGPLFYDQPNLF